MRTKKAKYILVFALAVLGAGLIFAACRSGSATGAPPAKKLIVLGIDGMDYRLLQKYMTEGKMPNFSALAERGSFRPLTTSTPPQSPVAWSNLITGMDPGGHGIFDFIHRNPATMEPYLSTSSVEPPKYNLRLGNWVFPLSAGKATLLRQGKAFWEYLDEKKIPATIFRMPANFPPVETESRTFSGMGTPDLLGTYGTFSYYTDDLLFTTGSVDGGKIYSVRRENDRVDAKLYGPYNTFRKDARQAEIDFTVFTDPAEPVAKISIQGKQILLREGEWSDWISVDFELLPWLANVRGMCRFYLKQVHPQFELYVTPVNIDPSAPALPISTPDNYAPELSEHVGRFYTLGISEDTKALSAGIFTDGDYLQQARLVLQEQRRIFDVELARFQSGLLFFYFSSIDQNSHMVWNRIDPAHPSYDAELAGQYSAVLEEFYRAMDDALGSVLRRIDSETELIVLSDHGFAPFYRSFNLNTWLLEKGYIVLKDGTTAEGQLFANVDWKRTRAYGLGLNGLYVNLRGRERDGIVAPGSDADALRKEIADALLALRDPANNQPMITRVDHASQAYHGAHAGEAPDLLVGYALGYRVGWGSVLGEFSAQVVEDNLEPWSGDHCIDPAHVPGVLLSNRKIAASAPSLLDIAPTILEQFGIAKPADMQGQSVFQQQASKR